MASFPVSVPAPVAISSTSSATAFSRPVQIALAVGAATLTGLAGYAIYFDYRRQTDKEFRRSLRKANKKVSKHVESAQSAQGARIKKDLITAIIEISQEPMPSSPDESEKYFMENVAIGERLSAVGEEAYVPAALSFFRALRIYPSPPELMQIYEKTVVPPVFSLIKELIAISNTINSAAQRSQRNESIDDDAEEAEMVAALQAAVAGAGRA